jgi:hypothetical protein
VRDVSRRARRSQAVRDDVDDAPWENSIEPRRRRVGRAALSLTASANGALACRQCSSQYSSG